MESWIEGPQSKKIVLRMLKGEICCVAFDVTRLASSLVSQWNCSSQSRLIVWCMSWERIGEALWYCSFEMKVLGRNGILANFFNLLFVIQSSLKYLHISLLVLHHWEDMYFLYKCFLLKICNWVFSEVTAYNTLRRHNHIKDSRATSTIQSGQLWEFDHNIHGSFIVCSIKSVMKTGKINTSICQVGDWKMSRVFSNQLLLVLGIPDYLLSQALNLYPG